MNICDRHFKIDGSTVPAVETFYIGNPENAMEQFDLCASCAAAAKEFIMQPPPAVPRGPGRPKVITKEK